MHIPVFFLLGAFLLALQTSLFPLLPAWIGIPDLLFILIVFLSLHLKLYQGGSLILLFGIVMDIFSGLFLGLYPLAYLGIFLLVRALATRLSISDATHQPPLMVLCYLLATTLIFLLATVFSPNPPIAWSWLKIIQQLLIVAVLAIPVSRFYGLVLSHCDHRAAKRLRSREKNGNRYR